MYGGRYEDRNAASEFEMIFGSVFQVAEKFLKGLAPTITTAIIPYLVCLCRGRGGCKEMARWVAQPFVTSRQVFNGMVNNRLRGQPGYQALMDWTRASLIDTEHEHRTWPGRPVVGSNYESASDDSAFENEYMDGPDYLNN